MVGLRMANSEGKQFVDQAVVTIEEVGSDVSALLALETKAIGVDDIRDSQGERLKQARTTTGWAIGRDGAAKLDPIPIVRSMFGSLMVSVPWNLPEVKSGRSMTAAAQGGVWRQLGAKARADRQEPGARRSAGPGTVQI